VENIKDIANLKTNADLQTQPAIYRPLVSEIPPKSTATSSYQGFPNQETLGTTNFSFSTQKLSASSRKRYGNAFKGVNADTLVL
jgi:hypothetical protein